MEKVLELCDEALRNKDWLIQSYQDDIGKLKAEIEALKAELERLKGGERE